MNVAWCVTGAGHRLEEICSVMEKLKGKGAKITAYMSKAAEEVVRMYGLEARIKKLAPGDYYEELFRGSEQGNSFPMANRLHKGNYDALVIAPATSNTIAKILCGISDTLVTSAFALALKSKLPIYLFPSDYKDKETQLPIHIDRKRCRDGQLDPAIKVCPTKAIYRDKVVRINLLKCIGCKNCVRAAPNNTITFGKRVPVTVTKRDKENVDRLAKLPNVTILKDPKEILSITT